jgi:hypothetical protein
VFSSFGRLSVDSGWAKLYAEPVIKERLIVYVDPAEGKRLRELSRERGAPVGNMVRRAIASWLQENAPEQCNEEAPIKTHEIITAEELRKKLDVLWTADKAAQANGQ